MPRAPRPAPAWAIRRESMDDAIDAIATPCGSCVHASTSGDRRWHHARQLPRRLQPSSCVPRARGTRSRRPPRHGVASSPSGCVRPAWRGGPAPAARSTVTTHLVSARRARIGPCRCAVKTRRLGSRSEGEDDVPAPRALPPQLPELRELERHVVGVEQRHRSGPACPCRKPPRADMVRASASPAGRMAIRPHGDRSWPCACISLAASVV